MTARYKPSTEKKNSAEVTATTKYARVRASSGSGESNFSANAAHSAVGIAMASVDAMMRRLASRGSARNASAVFTAIVC